VPLQDVSAVRAPSDKYRVLAFVEMLPHVPDSGDVQLRLHAGLFAATEVEPRPTGTPPRHVVVHLCREQTYPPDRTTYSTTSTRIAPARQRRAPPQPRRSRRGAAGVGGEAVLLRPRLASAQDEALLTLLLSTHTSRPSTKRSRATRWRSVDPTLTGASRWRCERGERRGAAR
jgi:hypothetical protein